MTANICSAFSQQINLDILSQQITVIHGHHKCVLCCILLLLTPTAPTLGIGHEQVLSSQGLSFPGPIYPTVPMYGQTSSHLHPGHGASCFLACLSSFPLVDSKRGRVLQCWMQACEGYGQPITSVFRGPLPQKAAVRFAATDPGY